MRVNNKQRFLIVSSLFIVLVSFLIVGSIRNVRAQQTSSPPTGDIASDLSLDLAEAQQNPAPDQQTIVASEVKQAEVVTNIGTVTAVKPQDIVAPEVKTESPQNAAHPEQTTSEQVVTIPVVVTVAPTTGEQNAPTSGGNQPTGVQNENINNGNQQENTPGNLVPSTSVPSPDDNAAPADNSTNPNLPAPTSADTTPTTIPLFNEQQINQPTIDNSQPGTQNPGQSPSDTQQPTNQPSSDNSNNTSQPVNAAPTQGSNNGQTQQSIPLESQTNAPAPTNSDSGQQPTNNPPANNPQPPQDTNSSSSNQQPTNPPASNDSGSAESTPAPTDSTSGSVQGDSTNVTIIQRFIHSVKNLMKSLF